MKAHKAGEHGVMVDIADINMVNLRMVYYYYCFANIRLVVCLGPEFTWHSTSYSLTLQSW